MRSLGMLVIVILVVAIVLAIAYGIRAWDKVVFKVNLTGVDLSQFNLTSLIATGQTEVKLIMNLTVKNDNSFAIPFKNMKGVLYYDKVVIGETSSDLAARSFRIPAHGTENIPDAVTIYLNQTGLRLIKEAVSKNNPRVDYIFKVNVFGVQLTYSDYEIFKV